VKRHNRNRSASEIKQLLYDQRVIKKLETFGRSQRRGDAWILIEVIVLAELVFVQDLIDRSASGATEDFFLKRQG
jgi:hypothetical protein